jgi:chemotaxis response regulator CheB
MSPEQSKSRKRHDQPVKTNSITETAQEPDVKSATPLESDFPVVGIGASAGGLEAFTQFLSRVPKKSGMAFVLVQLLALPLCDRIQSNFGVRVHSLI